MRDAMKKGARMSEVEKQYKRAQRKLEKIGDLSFLDDVPDDSGSAADQPFPYGSPKARPYGWFLN